MLRPVVDDETTRLLKSQHFSDAYLQALGRLVELSATLETLLRHTLCAAIGLGEAAGEALFLGDPANRMVERLEALREFQNLPGWVPEAHDWAKRVRAAIEERNKIVHRSPVYLTGIDEDLEPMLGLMPARRRQQPIPVDEAHVNSLLEIIRRLAALASEATYNLAGPPFAEGAHWERWVPGQGEHMTLDQELEPD